MKLFLKIGNVI